MKGKGERGITSRQGEPSDRRADLASVKRRRGKKSFRLQCSTEKGLAVPTGKSGAKIQKRWALLPLL